jgi:hypothetical protein
VDPLGHGTVRFPHLGDLRQQVIFPSAAFNSRARSFIAPRSSSVNPSYVFLAAVRLAGFGVSFIAGFLPYAS